MPLLRCQKNGAMGWKFGPTGTCFTGPGAREKALRQGRAIKANSTRSDVSQDIINRIRRRQAVVEKPKTRLPKKLPVWLYPRPVERLYEKTLVEYIEQLDQVIQRTITPHLQSLLDERNALLPQTDRADDYSDSIARLIEATTLGFAATPLDKKALADRAGDQTSVWNRKEWDKQLVAAFGTTVFQREPWLNSELNSFTRQNVSLISNMQADYLASIEGVVQRGIQNGDRITTIRKDIEKRTDVTKSRAQLIARDQVGKLNGNLTELRQTNLGVTRYTWRDSDDQRVRPNHASKDGEVFEWDNPPADTGHPGHDYQCRCYAEPDFSTIFGEVIQ